jgi:WD40 repeat protein
VLSGSDDHLIYVWHRERGDLLEYLSGHTGCVNCVAWNPKLNMFASASDDMSVRIWRSGRV